MSPLRREDSGLAGSPGPRVLPEPGGLYLDAQDQPEGRTPHLQRVRPAETGGVPGHPLTCAPPRRA